MTRRRIIEPAVREGPAADLTDDGRGADSRRAAIAGLLAVPALAACNPTVRVEAPSEPIEINLNVRIEQEVRIKIDRELDELFEEEDDIF